MGTTYTIGEVAKLIVVEGKNSSTVRLWTEMFADWLSPATRPEKGQLRLYTPEDVKVLVAVRDLRQQHLSYDEIRRRFAVGETTTEEEVGEKAAALPLAASEPLQVLRADELQAGLAPILEAVETFKQLSRESARSGFGFQAEIARLTATVEALNERVGRVQAEVQTLRADWRAAEIAKQRVEADGGRERAVDRPIAAAPANSIPKTSEPVALDRALEPEARPVAVWRPAAPAGEASQRAVGSTSSSILNEYGLRPLPAAYTTQALGEANLCPYCGSTTRPLGMTPTSRAVLVCIECGERTVVPLERLEGTNVPSRGLWSRLWRFLKFQLFS